MPGLDHPTTPDDGDHRRSWPLVLPALSAWTSALLLLGQPAAVGLTAAATTALATCALAWHTRTPSSRAPGRLSRSWGAWRNAVLATLICATAASASVAFRVQALTGGPVAELAARNATVTAQIVLSDDPKRRPHKSGHFHRDSYVIPATLKTIESTASQGRTGDDLSSGAHGTMSQASYPASRQAVDVPITVFASGTAWSALLPSQRLEVTGRLASPTPGDLVAAILLVRGEPRILTPPSSMQTMAGALRTGLRTAADPLPPDQRGLLPGLVVGDVSRIDPQVAADLKEAGLSHLNAVSGANLAIVAGAALAISRLVGLSLPLRAVFAAVAMLAFTVVARPSPSVLRALLMGLAAALALGTGRAKDGLAALSGTVLLLVLFAPDLARSYGFALSVAATAGILLLAPRWRDKLSTAPTPQRPTKADEPDAQAVAAVTGRRPPTADRHFGAVIDGRERMADADGRLSSSPPGDGDTDPTHAASRLCRLPRWLAEALAVSAAAQAAVTPVLVLMSGQLTLVAVPANLLVAPAVAPATLLGFAAALVAPIWPDAAGLLVVPAGYAVGWIVTVARWAVNVPLTTLPWPGGLPGLGLLAIAVAVAIPVLRHRPWRAMALVTAGAVLVAVLVIRPLTGPWPPKGWLMVMCDVGQGDGLVVAAGPGRGVVVDTGPDPVVMDRCLRRIGIEEVPLLVLTHPHADHVDGLPGVLRNRRVGAVVVSPRPTAEQASARISAVLARHRVPEGSAVPGTRWRFGPSELTVVAPDLASGTANGQGEGSVINNSSVVIHVRWRAGSALLAGDLETEAQDDLARHLTLRADILKTPHHGSNRQSPAFLASLGARAALISVGAGNDYGHPATSTLALLHRLGAAVHRTDRSGDLAVVEHEGSLAVVPRGP
ncbi:ComEC/Rec2 family competence protein [Nonomuraea spiralis]|uniref:ComEC/Rec2 family competence protein n=1 Tax=Nonomuraea spiralis TaxID=46182 RepID=A0ABV5IIP1_9ACTN|nr:ComEC/Rec2 family competence protein [Nonomuraea spiralis]GGT13617.1 competence protein ComEC [Nonomuraea spiralis]